jgi:DNA-binding transcriptional ArsR family regulator
MECQLDLLPDEILDKASDCLRVIAHPTRLRIVDILMQGEFPVGEIAEMCETSPSQTSEHLRLLKGQGLLDSERRSRSVYYTIADPRLPAMLSCIRRCCGMREV